MRKFILEMLLLVFAIFNGLCIVILILSIAACSNDAKFYTPTQQGMQCVTEEKNNIVTVNCPNGLYYSFAAPKDGVNGLDGQNGLNAQGIDVVDPCGDNPNQVDEVLLVFPDNSVLAWYLNVGFVQLNTNTVYQTTDNQRCNFMIDNNGNVVLQ